MRKAFNQHVVGATPRKLAKRFARDQRGNVLLMTAGLLIPILAIIGSGIDIGRSYMAQLRLQQACDAATLAGRRAMAGGDYTATAKGEAERMFYFNFPQGMYGTQFVNFSSVKSDDADVVGTAHAILPTALMHIFGFDEFNLSVDCGAKLEIANTDIMMVLDVTGSMSLDNGTKLSGLKDASEKFVNAITSADVGDGRIRIGMVPYSLTVNVGDILVAKNKQWLATSVTLPSIEYRTTKSGGTTKYYYDLKNRVFDVEALRNAVGNSQTFPVGKAGAAVTEKWTGCITEAGTKEFTGTTPPSGSYDLDIDHKPSSDDITKWKLYLPNLVYPRPRDTSPHTKEVSRSSSNVPFEKVSDINSNGAGCIDSKAVKLETITKDNKSTFINKVKALKTHGFTYHDVGMVWGGRLISPNGILGDENQDAIVTNGKPISRHILFMTDGDMDTSWVDYSHQGLEIVEKRVGTTSGTAWNSSRSQNQSTNAGSDTRHIKRFEYICDQIKQKDIKVWVVAFGFPTNQTPANNSDLKSLSNCASEGGMYMASDNAALTKVFVSIAGQISRLRVSK